MLRRILSVKFRHLLEGPKYTCKRHFATIISIGLLLVFLFNAVGISPAGAMRVVTGTNVAVYYILGDQLSSTSVVIDASGVKKGEQRYYPFGETRTTMKRLSMNAFDTKRNQTRQSAKALLELLTMIRSDHLLDMDQEEALREDEIAIQEIVTLLQTARTKEQFREIWDKLNQMKRDFGGYVGNEDGTRLAEFMENLWSHVFDLYRRS